MKQQNTFLFINITEHEKIDFCSYIIYELLNKLYIKLYIMKI